MYDELIKRLRSEADLKYTDNKSLLRNAANAIEKLSAKVDSLQLYVDSISKLPDCNTCLNNNTCEFRPKLGEYCRINCHAWLPKPSKEVDTNA